MKKLLAIILSVAVLLSFAACGEKTDKVIKVGASPAPHAEILEKTRAYIESKGYTLEIVEFTDYVQPNTALDTDQIDANYFQHLPYLEWFNGEHKMELVNVKKVHFEPFGIYQGQKGTTLDALKAGDKIAIPDDQTNGARALQLLAANGVITIKNDKGLDTWIEDIDTKGLEIIPLEAGLIASKLPELAFAAINGNYAVDFDITEKIVAQEDSKSVAAGTFANIIAVKKGNEKSEKTTILLEALAQKEIADYIESNYKGLVLPYNE